MASVGPAGQRVMAPGTPVAVFNRFSASWVGGFEIATTHDDGYQLVRLSDRSVVPKTFRSEDLRAQRR
jgi:uncharacterized protein YdiU (UPF0061 family)